MIASVELRPVRDSEDLLSLDGREGLLVFAFTCPHGRWQGWASTQQLDDMGSAAVVRYKLDGLLVQWHHCEALENLRQRYGRDGS